LGIKLKGRQKKRWKQLFKSYLSKARMEHAVGIEPVQAKKKRDWEVAPTRFGDLFRQRKSLLWKAAIKV
jgi:hypothetical protein